MRPCDVDPTIRATPDPAARIPGLRIESVTPHPVTTRRAFLGRVAGATAGLSCLDFLGYFRRFGLPWDRKAFALAEGAARAAEKPRFLIYWFLEGGWMGYDMFNPVMTANHVVHRLENPSDERYRVLPWGEPDYGIYQSGEIRYGYLAQPGADLFPRMAVLSSMHTGTGHSTERLRAHMGSYRFSGTQDREDDERSVNQAFAEVHGQPYALPSLSWHWWLSDGELNVAQYTGRKGFFHALGPSHAHTIYAGTPAKLKSFLDGMIRASGDQVNREIQRFLESPHRHMIDDANVETVKSYHAAREIYLDLATKGGALDGSRIDRLFTDPALREGFGIRREDELLTYRSVNGNKARSKFSPATNVQAMMAYELMRAGLSCTFWIESRDVRRLDSHRNRGSLWRSGEPVGQTDQKEMIDADLWRPLRALVDRLENTPSGNDGESLWDHTTIVLNSEFGRSLHGNVDSILRSNASDEEKRKQVDGQDISAHWRVTSAAFLGGSVQGNRQYGGVGETTLTAIPLLPGGDMDPAYHPLTGELRPGRTPHPAGSIPDHGDVYATALYLADVDPRGRGRNERGPLRYIKRHETRTV